jgi:hypothetical protein
VIRPNGGEIWFSGEIDTIRWQASDDIGVAAYQISYTTNNGGSWNNIQSRTNGNAQVHPWLVPSITTSNCKIRIIVWDEAEQLAADISDAPFTIQPADYQGPVAEIIVPEGGEIWTIGSGRLILWSATDPSGVDSVSLLYSTDLGQNWTTIMPSTHENSGSFSWVVPTPPSRQTMVRLIARDIFGNQTTVTCQAPFVIRQTPAVQRFTHATPIAR